MIFSGGPVITHYYHSQFIHTELKTNFPLFLDHEADRMPHAADVFVDSCLKYPQRDLPYETRLKWLGGFLMQPPTVRTFTFKREQKFDRWGKECTKTPHLLIQGQDDRHSDTEKMLPIATKLLPEMEVKLIPDIGHAPSYEASQEHNQYLLDFVQRVSGRK